MHKDILGTIVGDNESKSLFAIEPLDGSILHGIRKGLDASEVEAAGLYSSRCEACFRGDTEGR
jgi:hypothetical protein